MADGTTVTLDLDEFKKGSYDFPTFLRELAGRDPWKTNPSQFGKPQRELALWIADQIEAQTKPKLDEPGQYGVVAASVSGRLREEWVHTRHGWSNGYYVQPWKKLIDPVLVREGVDG